MHRFYNLQASRCMFDLKHCVVKKEFMHTPWLLYSVHSKTTRSWTRHDYLITARNESSSHSAQHPSFLSRDWHIFVSRVSWRCRQCSRDYRLARGSKSIKPKSTVHCIPRRKKNVEQFIKRWLINHFTTILRTAPLTPNDYSVID